MNTGICYLIGAGTHYENDTFSPDSDDYVIAVDGGYNYLTNNNIIPNLLVGDFDSIDNKGEKPNADCEILDFPPEKDYTDMYLAAIEGLKRGYRLFYIFGGTGNRVDHTLANLNLIAWLSEKEAIGYLFDEQQMFTAITDSSYSLSISHTDKYHAHIKAGNKGYISVLSHSSISEDVNIRGLKYPTYNVTMDNTTVLGTSNEFIGSDCSISVKNGTLIIVLER